MARSLIGLGSNLGDRAAILHQALQLLARDVGNVHAASSFYATRSVGGPSNQPEYLNAAAVCECTQSPADVLNALQSIEQQCGRQRDQRWNSRTLDLDLLLYDQIVSETPELMLPHPRMAFRRFVLHPAAEIAPQMIHPPTQFSILELLQRLDRKPLYVAVLGDDGESVARDAAERTGGVALLRSSFVSGGSAKPDELIELVRHAHEQWKLATANSPRAIVSDFWLGEFESVANPTTTRAEEGEQGAAFGAIAPAFSLPHLVVWLESGGKPGVSERMRQAVLRKRQFPVLVLYRANTTTAVLETVAAIEAME